MKDYLFRGSLKEVDEDVEQLIQLENERQFRKIILIPSESTAPAAVREALGSVFQNIYAEGYPDEESRLFSQKQILDYENRLGYFRRYSDPRYYKGVEYVDILEMLARRRCAELFATNEVTPDDIYVNVQPLSGAPANNAVYHALINPGDTIMGMNLLHGGHLSHGSPVNRSGKYYRAIHYTIDPETEKINYNAIESLARKCKPQIIVAGYSSYPWSVEWDRFKEIASSVGAYLLADIAHVAGLVAAGVYPSPVGYADVITFTTHKSLCGPRGACILTTQRAIARKIDRAVFPGEQGGPHANVFAGMAVTFKLAKTAQFRDLQQQIVTNCITFTEKLQSMGLRIPFGGTNTHLVNVDCSAIKGGDGTGLSGDQAARMLDITGIVVNRNTIPGDSSAVDPSGIRMGTPWVTQRGFKVPEMQKLAEIIGNLLRDTEPYAQQSQKGTERRAKVSFATLEESKMLVRELAQNAGMDLLAGMHGYPHFFFIDDTYVEKQGCVSFELSGRRVRQFLDVVGSGDISALSKGQQSTTCIHTPKGTVEGTLTCLKDYIFQLTVPTWQAGLASSWLRDLSDGYVKLDERADNPTSVLAKLPGPVIIRETTVQGELHRCKEPVGIECDHGTKKPYFIGIKQDRGEVLPEFIWTDEPVENKRSPIHELHLKLGAQMKIHAGWEMPFCYTSVAEEHLAIRQKAGLFDLAHMGVFQAEGPEAASFLDSVCSNDIGRLDVGESCYTHFLDPSATVLDDLMVYRVAEEIFILAVNTSNENQDWAWLNAVRAGEVSIDAVRPWAQVFGRQVVLKNLHHTEWGDERRVVIALQGPASLDILLSLEDDDTNKKDKMRKLNRAQLWAGMFGDFNISISRTGYTGEKIGFELFVHPDRASDLFAKLLQAGKSWGLQPIGLGARETLRIEAGLPGFGTELGVGSGKGGMPDLGVGEAGFAGHIKIYKPWFIGRESFIAKESQRTSEIVRFKVNDKGNNITQSGEVVLDKDDKIIGWVTSCSADSEGTMIGQVCVLRAYKELDTPIYIISDKEAQKNIHLGDQIMIAKNHKPIAAVVIDRFM